jgi:glycosyltransferase involved in cell wall biosynthesis
LVFAKEPQWRELIAREVERADAHIIYGFTDPLCRAAMSHCRRRGKPYFVWMESLQTRPRWHWRRVAREWVYRPHVMASAGVFAIGRQAAIDAHSLGADWSRIIPALYPGPAWRPGAGDGGGRVGYCGRLIALKGLTTLVEAAKVLARRGRRLGIDIIGDGPCRGVLEDLRCAGCDVRWHGAVQSEEVPRRLSNVAVLVLPTVTRDGWGYVVNEALAAGRPVVISDRVGARELVVAGRNGFVFPARSAAGLAEALEKAVALHSDRVALEQALGKTAAGFDPAAVALYMIEAIDALLTHVELPNPPWHRVVRELGGNDEVAWWDGLRSSTKR